LNALLSFDPDIIMGMVKIMGIKKISRSSAGIATAFLILFSVFVLSGCADKNRIVAEEEKNNIETEIKEEQDILPDASVNSETENQEAAEPETEALVVKSPENTEPEAESTEPEKEQLKTADAEKQLKELFLSQSGIDEEDILTFVADDYDRNGSYEAFTLVGAVSEYDDAKEGEIWFVDENQCLMVIPQKVYWSADGKLDFERRAYAFFNEYYATGALSHVWTVKEGKPVEDEISCKGEVSQKVENNDFQITDSTYDMMRDSDGNMLGHTWKPYYFYYDEEGDCIHEYAGTEITANEAAELAGKDLVGEAVPQGAVPDSIIKRENGIIHINYHTEDEFGATFNHVSWNIKEKRYINEYDNSYIADPIAQDGIYLKSLLSSYQY